MATQLTPLLTASTESVAQDLRCLADVQVLNLQLVHAIRLGMERDAPGTCRKFGLQADQADGLRALPQEHLWPLVCAVGQSCLFVARSDLVALLAAPLDLVGTLASARPAMPLAKFPL
jgi:hypothetical protein